MHEKKLFGHESLTMLYSWLSQVERKYFLKYNVDVVIRM